MRTIYDRGLNKVLSSKFRGGYRVPLGKSNVPIATRKMSMLVRMMR